MASPKTHNNCKWPRTILSIEVAAHLYYGNVPRLSATRAQPQITDLVSLLEMFEEATNSLQDDIVTSSVVISAILGVVDSMLAAYDTQYNTFKLQLCSALQRWFSDSGASVLNMRSRRQSKEKWPKPRRCCLSKCRTVINDSLKFEHSSSCKSYIFWI